MAAVLARRGLASIDADEDPLLARFVDLAGAVVAEEPAAPDLDARRAQQRTGRSADRAKWRISNSPNAPAGSG